MFLKAHLHIFFTGIGLPSGIPSTHETSESSHRNIRMIFHFFVSWRFPVLNLLLSHWSSQLFDLHVSSSTDVPVLLLNQPTISWQRESARKGLNAISDAQFAALPLVKPVVWFARVVVNWRSRSIAKSAWYLFETALRGGLRPRLHESG